MPDYIPGEEPEPARRQYDRNLGEAMRSFSPDVPSTTSDQLRAMAVAMESLEALDKDSAFRAWFWMGQQLGLIPLPSVASPPAGMFSQQFRDKYKSAKQPGFVRPDEAPPGPAPSGDVN